MKDFIVCFTNMGLTSAPQSDLIEYDTFAMDFNVWKNANFTSVYIVYNNLHVTFM
jgi:hypothetical protein